MKKVNNVQKNRRKDTRKNADVEIEIANILFKDDEHFQIGRTKNISCSGMYCSVNKYLEPLTKVQGMLKLPIENDEDNHISFNGIIVRIEPEQEEKGCTDYSIAIFFNDLEIEDKKKINQYLDSRG